MFVYSAKIKRIVYDEVIVESDVELDDNEIVEKAEKLANKMFECDDIEIDEIETESRPTTR